MDRQREGNFYRLPFLLFSLLVIECTLSTLILRVIFVVQI